MSMRHVRARDALVTDMDASCEAGTRLTEGEQWLGLEEWNRTAAAYPERSLVELFEGQVERTPDADAVVDEGERLSYRELNRRANRVAHRLLGRGLGAESVVGLCVGRSAEQAVGLRGSVKA